MRNDLLRFVFLIVLVFLRTGIAAADGSNGEVCFNDNCFTVEVVNTPVARAMGLMWRTSLAEGTGMLFEFDEPGIHVFWMKNMSFPIDMIWLDNEKKIVQIKGSVPPCQDDPCPTYDPGVLARYVLEVAAGTADRLNLKVGDAAEMQ